MQLDEATQILKNAGYLVEYTSMYSALSDFYRYLKIKVPKTGYDLDIEGDENSITVKFMGNVAKVTLETFDEDEDPMLYVEVEDDERAFYNEHTDYGNALQFIIKNICPTNESVNENGFYLDEGFDSVMEFIQTGLSVLFSPYLRVAAICIGPDAEDDLTEHLEEIEYSIIKKIKNNKALKYTFNKILFNENLREKVKNKLLEMIENRYGYLDSKRNLRAKMIKILEATLNNLEKNL